MIPKLERERLTADLAAVDQMLARAPAGDRVGQRSLAARRDALVRELAALETPAAPTARAALFFGGAPVVDARGIDSAFAARALEAFDAVVTTVWGTHQHGRLPASGPVRDRGEARLHVTDVVRGSFGFELAELEGALSLGEAPLHDAVNEATRAIAAAAEGDEALADAAQQLDARALAALHDFFVVLKRSRATVRIVAGEADRAIDLATIALAVERTEATFAETPDATVEGVLLGVLPAARTFELRTMGGELLRGRISAEIDDTELTEINPRWASQRCMARVRIVTITRRGTSRSRYELRQLAAPPADTA